MKTTWKIMAALLLSVVLTFGSGCTKDPDNGGNNEGNGTENGGGDNNSGGNSGGGTEEGMYLGIIGFNDALTTKSISLLNTSTEYSFTNFIRELTMRDGTALYHADNTALDWLQSAALPPDLINVSLVTFTDGLDNGSLILNHNYSSQAEFLNAVNNRILNDHVGEKSVDAYAIGMKGNDVQDYASFQQNLRKLSSDPSHNVFEVEDWDEVKQRFREIAIQLYNETTTVNTNVKIPGGIDNGTVVRITFDNVSNGNNSTQYIQGTYTFENGKGKLSNINYYGLQSSSGSTVISDRQDGICFWYTFAELKTPDGNAVNNTDHMNLWYYNSNTTNWQHETEFTPSSYSNTSVERKSAVTVLVLDCTTSLGSDFERMKDAAIEFVEVLNNYNGGNSGGGNGGGSGGGGNANSHDYVDLGLPSGTLWATCNIGAETPEDYGDYFAWGEIQPKDYYDWSTYQYCNGSNNTLFKYCTTSGYGYNGFTDNLTTLLSEDDAATVNWGNDWEIPTQSEWSELLNNTTNTWTTRNGVYGRLFTATNGNSLFLPAAGRRHLNSINYATSYGYYWSNLLYRDYPESVWGLDFGSVQCSLYSGNFRNYGQSVRAVLHASKN